MTDQIAEPRSDAAGEQMPAARCLRRRAKAMPTVVITGAGSGLGEACAMRMATRGWTVIALGRRRRELERSLFEVARAVEFFLEPGLLGITGQVMAVDGGFSVAGI
jgi:enoyl-[acyl-carrier-protein] reductase (NADH)